MKKKWLSLAIATAITATTLAAPLAAETVRTRIRPGQDFAYTFFADTDQQAQVRVMWDRANADLDVFVFLVTDDEDLLVAASTGATDGLEAVEVGVIPGEQYAILISHFSGPSAKFQANVSTTGSELVSAGAARVSFGLLEQTFDADQANAMRATLQKLEAVKAR